MIPPMLMLPETATMLSAVLPVLVMPVTLPEIETAVPYGSMSLGASLRDRAIRSNLRSLALPPITAPIPRASAR